MNKNKSPELIKAFEIISQYAYNITVELKDGMSGGTNEDLGFDEKLAVDISKAFSDWRARTEEIKDPYSVWFFDGERWSKVTKNLYQEDAYKEWYRLTSGGRKNSKPSFETYYFLGSSYANLVGRHEIEEQEDDFSIRYLLNKSFGD